MSNIQTYVNFYTDNVCLAVSVKDDLTKEDGYLVNYGYVEVDYIDSIWDNLDFFINADFETFEEECREDLLKQHYSPKKIYKEIKQLLKRAKQLNLLTYASNKN